MIDVFHQPWWSRLHHPGAVRLDLLPHSTRCCPVDLSTGSGPLTAASPPGFSGLLGQAALSELVARLREVEVVAAWVKVHPLAGRLVVDRPVNAFAWVESLPPPVVIEPDAGSVSSQHRRQIRQAEQAGIEWVVHRWPCPVAVDRFVACHAETMARRGASAHYDLTAQYVAAVMACHEWGSRMYEAQDPDGATAAAMVVLESAPEGGIDTYQWGATADRYVTGDAKQLAPHKLLMAAAAADSRERGARLNLAGGMTPFDELERYKIGFGGVVVGPHVLVKIVADVPAYRRACRDAGVDADPAGFFPPWMKEQQS